MHLAALLLSRTRFAFTISFPIIFPAFTVGLQPGWPVWRVARSLVTGQPADRRLAVPAQTFHPWSQRTGLPSTRG